jgi:membrane associated rhomboid family serine protease
MVVALVCLLLALLPASLIEQLSGSPRAILQGELWRLWSGHVVHFSARHALIDSATLLSIGAIAEGIFGSRRVALSLLAGAPLISIATLLAAPALFDYRGASCLAVMLASAIGLSWWRSRPASRAVLATLALCALAKIGFDAIGMSVTLTDLPDAIGVAWQGHLLSCAVGALMYLALDRAQHTKIRHGLLPPHTALYSWSGKKECKPS